MREFFFLDGWIRFSSGSGQETFRLKDIISVSKTANKEGTPFTLFTLGLAIAILRKNIILAAGIQFHAEKMEEKMNFDAAIYIFFYRRVQALKLLS